MPSNLCLFLVATASIALSDKTILPPAGAAAWVYDVNGGQPAMWAGDIAAFNAVAKQPINTIFSYGGDMEYYPGTPTPYNTYFPPENQQGEFEAVPRTSDVSRVRTRSTRCLPLDPAAATYASTAGVANVITVIDGRMDGGQPWSPDLSKLNKSQIQAWADEAADVYCSVDAVDGIQVDLEPFSGKYAEPLLTFVTRLAANLRSPERNCVSAAHPGGRSVTMFMFASAATPAVWAALGPSGFVTVSGYDLSGAPPGTPSAVPFYTSQLTAAVAEIAASAAAADGAYFVGIPAAASTHEFHTFTWANGTVVNGFPQVRLRLTDPYRDGRGESLDIYSRYFRSRRSTSQPRLMSWPTSLRRLPAAGRARTSAPLSGVSPPRWTVSQTRDVATPRFFPTLTLRDYTCRSAAL